MWDYLNENFEGIMQGLCIVVLPVAIVLFIGYLSNWSV